VHHAIRQLEHVAPGGIAVEVAGEGAEDPESVPANRRREFFAPFAIPATFPCCSVIRMAIRSDSP
jgi:hypothetical protein